MQVFYFISKRSKEQRSNSTCVDVFTVEFMKGLISTGIWSYTCLSGFLKTTIVFQNDYRAAALTKLYSLITLTF